MYLLQIIYLKKKKNKNISTWKILAPVKARLMNEAA